ncbi:vegetative incompatibility protein HET-E-1 [Annulohypoxylon maeteangense]|uniref:vegetative incompatibility protein HET-E-1 n=1 Tax=Annulohypoxylon maeteangense TaxID=1927788 RepID=UPI002008C091|nr:vegetative incompatibility protein HET-E-1 [Annulohypoxylon maeteangense]KAI0884183.1 vegetative incompatibility protein HET-E-1 [Annulohypoxylon maeteangense]
MRLLQRNDNGVFELTRHFAVEELPSYAILSHTWLSENDQEVSYDDLIQSNAESKPTGYSKIQFCGEQAAKDGLEYFWLDTCCINRNSSAELQEAITTMFVWYRNATRCYAYLTDVSVKKTPRSVTADEPTRPWELAFRRSRWFTRGWTLQELLAPASVEFFSAEGIRLGDKKSLQSVIHEITGIPYEALRGDAVTNFTVDQRLSWAANRQTKRKEDKAYCLLGLFNIFMPLLYGEGDHAFERLRQEIDRKDAENAKRDYLLTTLPVASEAAFNSRHNQHEPTCLPNTRMELLLEIEHWLESPDERCIFWLNGIAGTGKSTVARTVARTYYNRGKLGANFFFSRGGGDLGNAIKLVTTLSRQLAARLPPVRPYICEAIDGQEDVMGLSLKDQWQRLIINPLSKLHFNHPRPTVLIVIDALDECENEGDVRILIRTLSTARTLTNIRLRIFVTSRPEILIRHGFTKIPEVEREVFALHEISPDIVDRDLSIFFENHFSAIREERGFDDDWPGMRIIKRLVEISCGLFIWASTACRFIREGRRLAKSRIKILINGYRSGAGPEKQLDLIYTNVLRNSIQQDYNEKEKEELYGMLREVLGSIVILCSPLSMESLAKLLAIPLDDIKDTLADLHTIFNIPPQTSYPLRLHHPTFRDFLLNKERCSDLDFWVDEKQAHQALADSCLALMSKKLKSDICGLGSPGTLVDDIDPDLIERCISPDLQYACLYWVEHCRQSGRRLADGDPIDRFFREHFLHWLEAINLMGKSAEMGAIIRLYHALLMPDANPRQLPFVKDARRFIFKFQNIIKRAPLQTYCAALSFVPSTNELKFQFRSQMHPWIKGIRIAEADVPAAKDEFNYVSDLAFTPDSKQIASGSNFEAVRFWDVASKTTLAKYEGATDKMSSVAISPDGMTIAAGSDDFTVMAWDIKTRALRYSIKAHSGWVNSVFFSPDGKILASGAMDETIALWDALTGREIKRIDNQSSCVNTATFSPDGSLIATGSVDGMIRLWDVSNDSEDIRLILDGHSGCVNSVRFSPNGNRIVSGSDDMTIKLWGTTTGTEYMTLKGHTKKVMAVAFSLDSHLIASGSEDKTVRIWDAVNGTAVAILRDHTSGLNSVLFSPNGKLLASSSFDDEVRLWDTNTWALVGKLDDFEEDINPGILPSRQSSTISTGEMMESVMPSKGHSSTITRVVFSPDGQWLASGSEDATIKIWLRKREHHKLGGHSDRINDLAFSPDSDLIASASADKTVRLWSVATGVASHIFEGHSDSVLAVLFSPDGQLVASRSNDTTIILWDPSIGVALGKVEGHSGPVNGIAFSPDNRFIVSCSVDTTALLSDLENNAASVMLRGHTGPVNSIAFSSDSKLLVSGSEDSTIRFWSKLGAGTGVIRDTLPINSACFSPDSQLMASCSIDGTIRLWDPISKSAVGSLNVGTVVRNLSFSSCGQYLETDRGVLNIASFNIPSSSSLFSSTRPYSLFVTHDWLRRDMENALWLPNEYHATDVATWGNLIVLGHSTGSISFIEFRI